MVKKPTYEELEQRVKELERVEFERKRVEEVLLETAERFRLFSESSFEGIAIADKGIVLETNYQFASMLGYEPSQIIGMELTDIVAPESRSLVVEHIRSGSEEPLEFLAIKKDGSTLEIEAHGRAIPYEGRSVRGAAFRDLSYRKKLESQLRQAQKMEAIGTLAGGIAHDFNNILSAIIGYSELVLIDAEKGSSLYNNLRGILAAGGRAKDLVKQILAFSRQAEYELKPIQVKLICKEALEFLRASIASTIKIRQDIQCDALVMADPTHVHQIIMNICTNAEHAMREKGGVLEVKLAEVKVGEYFTVDNIELTPGRYLELTVSDTGHGMPAHILDRIFDPFYTTKETGEGTGMGLSVIHGIVGSYGGAIKAYSEPGEGSTFKVYFPVIERQLEPQIQVEEPIAIGTERILFVDDEPALVNIGKQMLEYLGYTVTTRTSSLEALELFKAKPNQFDLVITDMAMPNMSGDILSAELMKVRPRIPVILCTGYSSNISDEAAMKIGIKAFAYKPITRQDLQKSVRRVLDES